MKHLKQNLIFITILIVIFSSCKKETGITGIVKDNANTLVEGVEISVDGTVLATTDEYGSYEILDLIEGKYLLTTNKTGYLSFSQEINIEKKSIKELNITLEKIAFTITAPHSTSVWEVETQNRITWTNNYPGNVKIELLKGNNLNQVIEANTENDGTYDWTIPSDLAAGTDYKIKITSVDNSEVISQSGSFEITRPLPPTATTLAATGILSTSVNLNAIVNANDLTTTVSFEYGTTTSYGSTISPTISEISGTDDENITTHLTGLTESTTYHFRIKAESSAGITYGNDLTFITLSSTGAYLTEFTGKTLNYNNGSSSWATCTPFFGINSDEVTYLPPTATASSLDIGLAAQNTYGNVLASPDGSWYEMMVTVNGAVYSSSGKNHTKLQRVTIPDWSTVTADYVSNLVIVEEYFIGTEYGVGVSNMSVNDIVAFETYDGVKGLLKITASTNSFGSKATASITADFKVLNQ